MKEKSPMAHKNEDEENRDYLAREGLDRILASRDTPSSENGVVDAESGRLILPIPPRAGDLVRLHKTIRRRKCFTVLEFGVGYSTLVMADALEKNCEEWERLPQKPAIRQRFMFQLFSVDASHDWIEQTRKRLPQRLAGRVHLHYSDAAAGTFNGQLCHYYTNLPDIVPDFIYLDGPSPKDVAGRINGLSFLCNERTVMSGDLLLMEPTFLPGTFIMVDGRVNNARFLKRNFSREYRVEWDREADVTTFELVEERLGKHNLLGSDLLK
jgi:hypothetical protein